jgi:hypothetical protein
VREKEVNNIVHNIWTSKIFEIVRVLEIRMIFDFHFETTHPSIQNQSTKVNQRKSKNTIKNSQVSCPQRMGAGALE